MARKETGPTQADAAQSPLPSGAMSDLQKAAVEQLREASSLHQAGKLEEAILSYQRVLSAFPNAANVLSDLGVALRARGKTEAAIACYQKAIALGHNNAGTWSNMGNAYRDLRRYQDAVACHRKAVELDGENTTSIYNLGLSLRDVGVSQEALRYFHQAAERNPDNPDHHWDLSISYLQIGDYKRGFDLYDWRKKLSRAVARDFKRPEWNGEPLAGRSLFVHGEQGFGDMLQFARFIPRVADEDGDVHVECHPGLLRLFSTLEGDFNLVSTQQDTPDTDLYVSLLSLARIYEATLDRLMAENPYFKPHEISNIQIAGSGDKRFKIGIMWAGKLVPRDRSCPLTHFLELAAVPGVALYSLQMDERAGDMARLGTGGLITDVAPRIGDFADTASVISQLDLVLTIDTAVCHLAGGLGAETWTLLNYVSDWRWLLDRGDSPWYPNMRLFRQPASNDWDAVFREVKPALKKRLEEHATVQST
ncbi:MAG: tetratricopeptide repeat-containing glycosyltransferase family protein [Proteobacteria bacterium]|nr:tetratricopeptide repeat-containing glycosyltransferase family protein [Pseudomonadota bacterium]